MELAKLRGDGRRETMEERERIYEYDYYNNDCIGNSQEQSTPIIGGSSSLPYPRRLRTLHPSNLGKYISRSSSSSFSNYTHKLEMVLTTF